VAVKMFSFEVRVCPFTRFHYGIGHLCPGYTALVFLPRKLIRALLTDQCVHVAAQYLVSKDD